MGHFGFSYVGLVFLLMLFIPNIIWSKHQPKGYSADNENKVLAFLEHTGQAITTCCALCFSDFNLRPWSAWSWWLIAAFAFMLLYEMWWIRYFKSEQTLADFYSSILGVPLAGATLPVIGFFLLGIYGKVIWMLIGCIILGIGHIGIHYNHYKTIE